MTLASTRSSAAGSLFLGCSNDYLLPSHCWQVEINPPNLTITRFQSKFTGQGSPTKRLKSTTQADCFSRVNNSSVMKIQIVSSLLAIALLAGSAQARSLQQSFSSSSAVSVSGGSGPYGNCGSTQVIGTGSVSYRFGLDPLLLQSLNWIIAPVSWTPYKEITPNIRPGFARAVIIITRHLAQLLPSVQQLESARMLPASICCVCEESRR